MNLVLAFERALRSAKLLQHCSSSVSRFLGSSLPIAARASSFVWCWQKDFCQHAISQRKRKDNYEKGSNGEFQLFVRALNTKTSSCRDGQENKPGSLDSRKARRIAKNRDDQLSPARQYLLDQNIDVIEYFDRKVAAEDAWIAEIAANNPDAQRLKSIPGIGDVAALMLIAEFGDVSRFKKAKNASAYLGLVPRVYATSDTRRIGRITKIGSAILRWLLVQDAWSAIRQCAAFKMRYTRIMKRRGKHIAIVAIARMLAEIAYRVLRDQTTFDETKLALG